jgi:CelD/BcsL family acetyltransferase involved in cellulose biosynthesis
MNAPTRGQVRVSRLSTVAEIDSLEHGWRALEGRCSGVTPFMTWEWNASVARHYGGERPLWVMTIHDGDDLIGIAPLAETRLAGLRVLRVLSSALGTYSMADYQDLLLAKDREDEAIMALCDNLTQRRGWDVFHCQELPEASPTSRRLMEVAALRGWPVTLQSGSDVHSLPISGSWDEYKATLSRSTRNDGGRLTRKLIAEHGMFFTSVDGDLTQVHRVMEDLFDLHTRRWQSVGKPGIFRGPRQREFHQEVASRFAVRGMLAVSVLRAGEETIAIKYGFQTNGTRYYYSGGFSADPKWDHFRLGLVLDLALLKDAFDQGTRCVDFMRGDGHYKDHYRMDTHLNLDLTLFPSQRARLQYRLAHLARGGMARMRRRLAERSERGGDREKAA